MASFSFSYSTSPFIEEEACGERVRENTHKEKSAMVYVFPWGNSLKWTSVLSPYTEVSAATYLFLSTDVFAPTVAKGRNADKVSLVSPPPPPRPPPSV